MAQISLRVDDDVKRGAEQTFDDIGLSMSTAINIFEKGWSRATNPFWIDCWSILFESNMHYLEKDVDDLQGGAAKFGWTWVDRGVTMHIRAVQWDFDAWEDYLYCRDRQRRWNG